MINLMSSHESRLYPPDGDPDVTGPAAGFVRILQALSRRQRALVKTPADPARVTVPPYYPDTPKVRASLAQHYDNISVMDAEVGKVIAALEEDGLMDNTIVIWTTDHGDGLPRAKRSVYESGIRVPLVIRYHDEHSAGATKDQLVSFVDLAPTILALAGIDAPDFMQGRDFLDEKQAARTLIFAARDRMDNVPDKVRAVRDSKYKYIRNYAADVAYFRPLGFRDLFPVMQELWEGHEKGTLDAVQSFYFTAPRPEEELYDLTADPYEVHNLAGTPEHQQPRQRLSQSLDEWIARVGYFSDLPEVEMVEKMWPGLKQPITTPPQITLGQGQDGQALFILSDEMEGASIGYRYSDDPGGRWRLYSEAIPTRNMDIEAKAIRYGYAESAVITGLAVAP